MGFNKMTKAKKIKFLAKVSSGGGYFKIHVPSKYNSLIEKRDKKKRLGYITIEWLEA